MKSLAKIMNNDHSSKDSILYEKKSVEDHGQEFRRCQYSFEQGRGEGLRCEVPVGALVCGSVLTMALVSRDQTGVVVM